MGKKNPFVTTVGFNRHDPAHVEVAHFLNGMERGKAQYIVDAVRAYRTLQENGDMVHTGQEPDYEKIRSFVLQVIREHEQDQGTVADAKAGLPETHQEPEQPDFMAGLNDDAVSGIMSSLEAFKG